MTRAQSSVADTTEEHPAYGQISASRWSSSEGLALYGSDFGHHHFIVVTISESRLHRGLSRDWPHPTRRLVQVAMSEAQWAAFVSTLNLGEGPQCTIQQVVGEREGRPGILAPPDRRAQFKHEVSQTMRDAVHLLEQAIDRISKMAASAKSRDEAATLVARALTEIKSNVPFVAKSFGEHVEKVTEHAKGEITAYMQAVIARAGLTSLLGGRLPLRLGEGKEVPDAGDADDSQR